MTPERALEACSVFETSGPVKVFQANLEAWLNGESTFEAVAYIFNMFSSDNLMWIDCMTAALR